MRSKKDLVGEKLFREVVYGWFEECVKYELILRHISSKIGIVKSSHLNCFSTIADHNPDVGLVYGEDYWPSVVLHVGTSDESLEMRRLATAWLTGGHSAEADKTGRVNLVIMVTLYYVKGNLRHCDLEVWRHQKPSRLAIPESTGNSVSVSEESTDFVLSEATQDYLSEESTYRPTLEDSGYNLGRELIDLAFSEDSGYQLSKELPDLVILEDIGNNVNKVPTYRVIVEGTGDNLNEGSANLVIREGSGDNLSEGSTSGHRVYFNTRHNILRMHETTSSNAEILNFQERITFQLECMDANFVVSIPSFGGNLNISVGELFGKSFISGDDGLVPETTVDVPLWRLGGCLMDAFHEIHPSKSS